MDFLESLYEIENFGIYLFVIIGILVVLFLVVLFFGKKDQKMRKKQEELEDAKTEETEEFAFQTTENASELNVSFNDENFDTKPEQEQPVSKEEPTIAPSPTLVFETKPTTNVVLNSDLELEPSAIETLEEAKDPDVSNKEFDFDALAEAISKELESIDNMPKKEAPKEEEPIAPVFPETKENNFQVFEPIRIEETSVKKEESKPTVEETEVKPRPVMPTVFSSVYVNREKEEPKKTDEPIKPIKPMIDLPKIADLPKRTDEPALISENLEQNEEDDGIIFR